MKGEITFIYYAMGEHSPTGTIYRHNLPVSSYPSGGLTVEIREHVGERRVLNDVTFNYSFGADGVFDVSFIAKSLKSEYLGEAPPLWFWEVVG